MDKSRLKYMKPSKLIFSEEFRDLTLNEIMDVMDVSIKTDDTSDTFVITIECGLKEGK